MERTFGVVGLGLLAACVGTSPTWDGPADASSDVAHAGDTDAGIHAETSSACSSEASGAEPSEGEIPDDTTDAMGTTDTTAAATTTSAESSTGAASTDGGGPVCAGGQALCDGECKDIAKDKHACGVDCIDCTELFDDHPTCKDGVCEGDEGKGG